MFILYKLYLAHLIADFLLQFEELYQLKVKHLLGHLLHVVIHFLMMTVLTWPYLENPFMWVFISSVTFIHFFQDLLKYSLQKKYPAWSFALFTLDQVFHLLFLSTILFFPVSKETLTLSGPSWLSLLYAEPVYTFAGMTFFLSTVGGSYLLYSFRKNYIPNTRPLHFITSFEVAYAMLERGFISGIFLFAAHPLLFLASPLIGVLRLLSAPLKSKFDFLLSFTYGAGVGLLFRFLM